MSTLELMGAEFSCVTILVASHASQASTRADDGIMTDSINLADVAARYKLVEWLGTSYVVVTTLTAVLASNPTIISTSDQKHVTCCLLEHFDSVVVFRRGVVDRDR